MTRLFPLLLIALPAFAAEPVAPPLPDGAVLTPQFSLDKKQAWYAGTAFATDYKGERLVLTAHLLLGPAGGWDTQIQPLETGSLSLTAKDRFNKKKLDFVATGLPVPGAYLFQQDPAGELAAFRVPDPDPTVIVMEDARTTTLHPLELAEGCPAKGTPAWLAFKSESSQDHEFRGTVDECDAKHLLLVMSGTVDLAGAAGAPIVDASGKVIGLMVAGGMDGKDLIAVANPVSSIRKLLDDAIAATPKPAPAPVAP